MEKQTKQTTTQHPQQAPEKKPWRTPELERLGSVKELTQGSSGPASDVYGLSV